MKKQRESEEYIVRSGTRIRESVRCLPRGHFQNIRQMFDKQIPQRQQNRKIHSSLSITNDEKLQNPTTNIDDIIIIENAKLFEEQLLKPTLSISNGNHFSTGSKKKTFVFERKKENKGNHLIECQRPVLSLFINHQGSIIKKEEKENCKKTRDVIEGRHFLFHEI